MEIKKYKSSEVLYHIRHNLRELPAGQSYGNESIVKELTCKNYSLLSRGNADEVNAYRKSFEKTIHIYGRKDLVHAIEIVIQVPSDCPPEQHKAFFQTVFKWVRDDYLKVPEAILNAVVHEDEKCYTPDGEMISKAAHAHILVVPVVEDTKHDTAYKLCSSALTNKKMLSGLHGNLQKKIDAAGIQATVVKRKPSDGKIIPLTVKQLKEITSKTGLKIDHSLTIDELGELLAASKELEHLRSELVRKESALAFSEAKVQSLTEQNESLQRVAGSRKEELKKVMDQVASLEAEAKTQTEEPAVSRNAHDNKDVNIEEEITF